mmetsp:Transcript_14163/g.40119  ORF Transcript_14163/g.40119 Transcript_14163/m.40119 type:complete len:437 (+) Transcript_14163:1481-2791(+)
MVPVRVPVAAAGGVQGIDVKGPVPHEEVIRDDNACDRSKQGRISNEPGEDVALRGREQPPRLSHDAEQGGDERSLGEGHLPWGKIDEGVRRGNDVGRDVRADCREHQSDQRKDGRREPLDSADDLNWIRDDLAEDHGRRTGHSNPQEREEGHEDRQANGLACELGLLTLRIPREVRDVEGQGGPEADVCGHRRQEHLHELPFLGTPWTELRGCAQHGTDAVRSPKGPDEQSGGESNEDRSGVLFHNSDAFDPLDEDKDLDEPENHEKRELRHGDPAEERNGRGAEGSHQGLVQRKQRGSSDPGLDSKPDASHQASQHANNCGSTDTKSRSGENGERHTILCATVCVQNHGNKHDRVGHEHGQNSLPPRHAELHQASREVVRRYGDDQTNPQGSNIRSCESSFGFLGGFEVLVDQARVRVDWLPGREGLCEPEFRRR